MNVLLNKVIESCAHFCTEGHVATYIPELANANPADMGICVMSDGGQAAFAGDYNKKFTMQSVVKPMILLLALMAFVMFKDIFVIFKR